MADSPSRSQSIVVKIGGSTLGSGDTTVEDLVALQNRGHLPVVVHGGGRLISEWLEARGVATRFVGGLRVTDGPTLEVVVAVLAGLVNKELVSAINALGGRAVGLSGVDGGFIEARAKSADLGYVGEVVRVNLAPLEALLEAGYMPVVAPLGFQPPAGREEKAITLNINADSVAGEIALALKAERLIFLSDVEGVCDAEDRLLPRLAPKEAQSLLASGVISGGMIPKVEAALRALSGGTRTQIVDGRQPRALLATTEGEGGGTLIGE